MHHPSIEATTMNGRRLRCAVSDVERWNIMRPAAIANAMQEMNWRAWIIIFVSLPNSTYSPTTALLPNMEGVEFICRGF